MFTAAVAAAATATAASASAAVVSSSRVAFYCGMPAVTRIHNLHYTCAGVEFNYNFNCCKCTMVHSTGRIHKAE